MLRMDNVNVSTHSIHLHISINYLVMTTNTINVILLINFTPMHHLSHSFTVPISVLFNVWYLVPGMFSVYYATPTFNHFLTNSNANANNGIKTDAIHCAQICLWCDCYFVTTVHPYEAYEGRVTHTFVNKLTIISSDNGLSPDRRQAVIWTNAGILLIGPLGTNFSEILMEILTFSFKKMRLKVSSAKRRPFCLGLNVLKGVVYQQFYC